jgi:hypothetical protein
MSAVKALVGLVVLAAVLAVGLVAGDHYAEGRAEEYARGEVAQMLQTSTTPAVDIQGFPFLTQVLRGTLDSVTASASDAKLSGLAVTDVAIDTRGVVVRPPAGEQARAGQASVAATIPTSSLEGALKDRTGLTPQIVVDGQTLRASGTVLGLTLVLTLVPRVDNGSLVVDVQHLTLGGRDVDPNALPSNLRGRVSSIPVPLDALPQGLAVTQASVIPAGIRLTASGSNVVVPQAASGG